MNIAKLSVPEDIHIPLHWLSKKSKILSEAYEILPAVLVIHPSGYTLNYKGMQLEKNLVMYFAMKAVTEDFEDNYVGSILYDGDKEVRGPIIILSGILIRETDDDGRYAPWAWPQSNVG